MMARKAKTDGGAEDVAEELAPEAEPALPEKPPEGKVRILMRRGCVVSAGVTGEPGQTLDVPRAAARTLIEHGKAVPVVG